MDVCVVGHITKDLIRIPGTADKEMPGGSAFYVSVALRSLGLEVGVITKVAARDEPMLAALRTRGIRVFNRSTERTTVFENVYADASLTARTQRVHSVAAPITVADIAGVEAKAFHVGPLTREEIPVAVLRYIRTRSATLAFDAQGMLRRVVDGAVTLAEWPELEAALPLVDVLKVDDLEAAALAGERDVESAALRLTELGAREVLITFADRGSLVRTGARIARIPAIPPSRAVDATGCGDTYAAAYLYGRLEGRPAIDAAHFAAAAASLKLERYGPFEGSPAAVRAHLDGRTGRAPSIAPERAARPGRAH